MQRHRMTVFGNLTTTEFTGGPILACPHYDALRVTGRKTHVVYRGQQVDACRRVAEASTLHRAGGEYLQQHSLGQTKMALL